MELLDSMRFGAPGPIRTADHLVRSQGLYPAELRAQDHDSTFVSSLFWQLKVDRFVAQFADKIYILFNTKSQRLIHT